MATRGKVRRKFTCRTQPEEALPQLLGLFPELTKMLEELGCLEPDGDSAGDDLVRKMARVIGATQADAQYCNERRPESEGYYVDSGSVSMVGAHFALEIRRDPQAPGQFLTELTLELGGEPEGPGLAVCDKLGGELRWHPVPMN